MHSALDSAVRSLNSEITTECKQPNKSEFAEVLEASLLDLRNRRLKEVTDHASLGQDVLSDAYKLNYAFE